MSYRFRCAECGAEHLPDPGLLACPRCAREQSRGGPVRGVLQVELDRLPDPPGAGASEEEIRGLLEGFSPLAPGKPRPVLAVGRTPLLSAPRLGAALGLRRLYLKDDTRNPSGSTKDRASHLVVMKALEFGFETVAVASTGNAATALGACCAAAGIRAVVLVPASSPEAKRVQMESYGARLLAVDGTYDDAFELCLEACKTWGWYNRNTALNPYTVEGKKSASLEIAVQLAPHEADVVVVPTGDGVISAGIAKGFDDLLRAGWIRRRPRLVVVQPEGSSAIARAFEAGDEAPRSHPGAASVADSLVVEEPRNGALCLRRIRESEGFAVAVSEAEILGAIQTLARSTGVFAEPAAAAGLAGLERAVEDGRIDRDERVVLLVTGTGLKDVPSAARGLKPQPSVAPTLEAVAERVESWK